MVQDPSYSPGYLELVRGSYFSHHGAERDQEHAIGTPVPPESVGPRVGLWSECARGHPAGGARDEEKNTPNSGSLTI